LRVKDIMTRDLTAVHKDNTMREVVNILANQPYSGVPVIDEHNKVIGFISVKDVLMSEFPERISKIGTFKLQDFMNLARQLDYIGESKVVNFMNTRPVTVTEEDSVKHVINLVIDKGLKIIPVVRDEVLVGLVERIELCRAYMDSRVPADDL
jgi:predicted transcriptional regulator